MLTIHATTTPLTTEIDGAIRLTGTRILLDTIIYAFQQNHTAEQIVSDYPTLSLADVYAVLAYYLNHQDEVDTYLRQRAKLSTQLQEKLQALPTYRPPLKKQQLQQRLQADK